MKRDFKCKYRQAEDPVMYPHDYLKRAYQVINLMLSVDRPQNMFSLRALYETEKLQMLQGVGNRIRTQHTDT